MDNGYAIFIDGALGVKEPYPYKLYNQGIFGNRLVDLYARIRKDMIHLKPDYMSILINRLLIWFWSEQFIPKTCRRSSSKKHKKRPGSLKDLICEGNEQMRVAHGFDLQG